MPSTWIAWRRRDVAGRRRWEAVAEGQTEAEASARLMDLMARERSGNWSTIVLPAGEKP